jgi:GDP-4-dehydro-6-deoxy-D-mannose reductase
LTRLSVLVTGAKGFVAPYLVSALRSGHAAELDLIMTSLTAGRLNGDEVARLDVTEPEIVIDAIRHYRPSHVVHLAGIAAPAVAAADPQQAWRVHVEGSLNLAEAILRHSPHTCLIYASSGLIYGSSMVMGIPADERTVPSPLGSYAITKATADAALGALAKAGLACIRMRPFNHIGPGQSDRFLVPSLAMQLAKIEAGQLAPVMHVGNLDVVRDFLDVRDVARAYLLAVETSRSVPPGTAMNIASGTGYKASELLASLVNLSGVRVEVIQEPARMRVDDLPWLVGDPRLAHKLLGWEPEYGLPKSLTDIFEFCRARVRGGRSALGRVSGPLM